MTNEAIDQFILENLPATFAELHSRGDSHFQCETYRKIDQRLQSLRKRNSISFYRVKGRGTVWSVK